ncbi:hypothetical protein [Clostridium tyrobutyricum]|uniref:hypothetical protein n=1 Tax=Clostridium tyrobutyricum TaxID=1519 RepID=UPI00189CD236|nr:hypothetical protein [Clostridium tyrobutyricum]
MLLDRNLPCSMALISRFDTAQKWGIGTTWDDIRNWNRNPKPWIRKSSEGTIKKSGGKSGQNFLRIHAGKERNLCLEYHLIQKT